MRIDRTDADAGLLPQRFLQGGEFRGREAEPVHSGVELYVDGIVPQAAALQHVQEGLERVKVGNAGLEAVQDDFVERIGTGRQDKDGQGNTRLAEFDALQRGGHGEIVRTGRLHQGGEFHGAVPVGVGLYQHQHLRPRPQQRAEIPVVVGTPLQVDLQSGKVLFPCHGLQR